MDYDENVSEELGDLSRDDFEGEGEESQETHGGDKTKPPLVSRGWSPWW